MLRPRVRLMLALGAAALVAFMVRGDAEAQSEPHAEPKIVTGGEPATAPSPTLVGPSVRDERLPAWLRFELGPIFLPSPLAHAGPVFLMPDPGQTQIEAEDAAGLDAVATTAKEHGSAFAVVVTVARSPLDLVAIRDAVMWNEIVVEHLVGAGVPRSRILETVRLPRRDEHVGPGVTAVALVEG